jgi:hypothetical protein
MIFIRELGWPTNMTVYDFSVEELGKVRANKDLFNLSLPN